MKSLVLTMLLVAACEHGRGGGIFNPDGGSGADCGGFSGAQCAADEFCDFARDSCGASDETGTCQRRPISCPDLFDPVCGCDGVVHSNSCDAQSLGVDLNANGGCPTSPGKFACGPRECTIADQYCQRVGSDIGGEPDSFQCNSLPIGCNSASGCECVADEPCGDQCSGDGATGFTVICFGG